MYKELRQLKSGRREAHMLEALTENYMVSSVENFMVCPGLTGRDQVSREGTHNVESHPVDHSHDASAPWLPRDALHATVRDLVPWESIPNSSRTHHVQVALPDDASARSVLRDALLVTAGDLVPRASMLNSSRTHQVALPDEASAWVSIQTAAAHLEVALLDSASTHTILRNPLLLVLREA